MIWIQPGFSWTWNWTFPSLGLFGGKASMFEIWTFPNIFLFFATLWGRKSSIPHNHTFNFFWGKFKFWSLDVPQLIVFHFWGGQVQFLKSGHLHFFGGKVNFSRIVRPRPATIAFFGEKFNSWSPDLPQLHFLGGKVQFVKYGRATIDNCIFWGKNSIPEVWTCHNCIFWGEKFNFWSAKIKPK